MVFVFLCFTSFIMIISKSSQCSCKWHYFIHFNACIYIYHIFFIHSSVDGCLDCFYVLAVVNGAEVNIGVSVSF